MLEAKPWLVETMYTREKVFGTLFDAMVSASQLLLITSEWPKKGKVVTFAKITRDEHTFTLTLETPNKPDNKNA